jgi:bacillithiol system protein YtxJ
MTAHAPSPDVHERFRDATALVFKHSNACDLSDERLQLVEAVVDDTRLAVIVIPVQRQRALSDAVAEHFGIRHATPQAIVLHRGQVIGVRSHWGITREWLEEMLRHAGADAPGTAAGSTLR